MRSVPRPPLAHICTGCSHIVPSWFLMCERVLVGSPADGEQRGGVLQDRQRCGSEGPDVCHALQTGEDQGENSCRSVWDQCCLSASEFIKSPNPCRRIIGHGEEERIQPDWLCPKSLTQPLTPSIGSYRKWSHWLNGKQFQSLQHQLNDVITVAQLQQVVLFSRRNVVTATTRWDVWLG